MSAAGSTGWQTGGLAGNIVRRRDRRFQLPSGSSATRILNRLVTREQPHSVTDGEVTLNRFFVSVLRRRPMCGDAVDEGRDTLKRVGEGAPPGIFGLPKPQQVGSDEAKTGPRFTA
jgi:hypothetical protein